MPSIDDIIYTDGTISIGATATSVVGSGTMWAPYNAPDRFFLILIVPGKGAAIVTGVTDDTHLVIPSWQGSAVAPGSAYQLVALPFSSLVVEKRIRDFLEQTLTQGIPYVVPDNQEEPNDAIGDDGMVAIRFNPKPIVFWKRVDGHYAFQGNFVGIGQRFPFEWDAAEHYFAGDITGRLGKSWISNIGDNVGFPPESSPDQWSLFASGGGRVEISFSAPGRPASSEVLIDQLITAEVVFPATLPESLFTADAAATGSTVFTINRRRSGVATPIGTATFGAGDTAPTFSFASDQAFVADDRFQLIAPASPDASLAGLLASFVGYR